MPGLRAAFDADFANDPREPLRRSALGGVASLLDGRQAPIDPSRVRVQVQRRTFLAPLWDLFENTLTDRQTLAVDLDADGVPDLRVVISNDSAHTARAPT